MIDEPLRAGDGLKGKLMLTLIMLSIVLFACLITFTVFKIIYLWKKPKPLSRFQHGIELTLQNHGTLPFFLNGIAFSPGAFMHLSIYPESHMADVRQGGNIYIQTRGIKNELVLPEKIPVSDHTWKMIQDTPITSRPVSYALFGGLFSGMDHHRPQLSISVSDLVDKNAASQYWLQPLVDGGYEIVIYDFLNNFKPTGPIRGGFSIFKGKTSGHDDIVGAILDLLKGAPHISGRISNPPAKPAVLA